MVGLIRSSSFCSVSFHTTKRSLLGLAGTSASRNSMVFTSPVFQCLKLMNFFAIRLISRVERDQIRQGWQKVRHRFRDDRVVLLNLSTAVHQPDKAGCSSVRYGAAASDTEVLDPSCFHVRGSVKVSAINDHWCDEPLFNVFHIGCSE